MQMQDMEHILKILTLAEQSSRIGIVLGPDAGDAELLAAHALKGRLGEKASLLNAPDSLQDRWTHLFKKERPHKETALALDVNLYPVDELRYEKENGTLRIFLTSHNPLPKDAFSMEERFPPSDMIIALGFSDKEALEHVLKTETPVKNENAVVFLASSPREAAAPSPEHTTAQQITSDGTSHSLWNLNAMKLWSRALLRSYIEDGESVFWAFLPKEDFQKTGQAEDILPLLVNDMRHITRMPPLIVVLWQSLTTPGDTDSNVHILFSSTDSAAMEKLSRLTGTTITHNVLITGSFSNFSTAEVEARKVIKHIAHST